MSDFFAARDADIPATNVAAAEALAAELAADDEAREALHAAVQAKDLGGLTTALAAMAERGLDVDEANIEAARHLKAELEASLRTATKKARSARGGAPRMRW